MYFCKFYSIFQSYNIVAYQTSNVMCIKVLKVKFGTNDNIFFLRILIYLSKYTSYCIFFS